MVSQPAVLVDHLDFSHGSYKVLRDISFSLPKGSRCVLVGANGVGKSTLLRILGGRHMHTPNTAQILGKSAFHETSYLNHRRQYVDPNWGLRTVAFAGCGVAYQADIPVREMMSALQSEYPERRDILLQVLEIDPEWKMHQVSDGQRRRVQLFLALIRPVSVILLDEVVAVLDILCRKRLLEFLYNETVQREATVVFATHVFDGLDDWITHLLWLRRHPVAGSLGYFGQLSGNPSGIKNGLFPIVERLLLDEEGDKPTTDRTAVQKSPSPSSNYNAGGYAPGRMLATVTREGGGFKPGRMYNYW